MGIFLFLLFSSHPLPRQEKAHIKLKALLFVIRGNRGFIPSHLPLIVSIWRQSLFHIESSRKIKTLDTFPEWVGEWSFFFSERKTKKKKSKTFLWKGFGRQVQKAIKNKNTRYPLPLPKDEERKKRKGNKQQLCTTGKKKSKKKKTNTPLPKEPNWWKTAAFR